MRRTLSLLLVAGCGRVAFDGQPDAADPPGEDAESGNCPPTLVADEDGDGVDDSCDVCPHISFGAQTDSDGDGVGDICDPNPEIPGERLAFFDGFNALLPEWDTDKTITGGQLVASVANADSNSVLQLAGARLHFELGGVITAVGPYPQQLLIGVERGDEEAIYVEIIDGSSGRRRSLMHENQLAYTELDGVTENGLPIPTGRITISLTIAADRLAGRFAIPENLAALQASGPLQLDSSHALLYVNNLDVAFDYALVIAIP